MGQGASIGQGLERNKLTEERARRSRPAGDSGSLKNLERIDGCTMARQSSLGFDMEDGAAEAPLTETRDLTAYTGMLRPAHALRPWDALRRSVTLLVLVTAACGPFSSVDYHIEENATAEECEASPSQMTLLNEEDARLRPLLDAFAGGDEQCARAVQSACPLQLTRCARTEGCQEFTECARDIADPMAESKCSERLGAGIATHWAYEKLRACWAEQTESCRIGQDWSCLSGYSEPSLASSQIVLGQELKVFQGPPATNVRVRICQAVTDCSDPLLEVTTDACLGEYRATFSSSAEPGAPGDGWEGYRLVQGEPVKRALIATNVPVHGRRVDVVRLFSDSQYEFLVLSHDVLVPSGAVFVQVLDCQSSPAPNVEFELTSETGRVDYPEGTERTDSDGAAALYNLEDGRVQRISAVLVDAQGERTSIASWEGVVTQDTLTYLKLYPEPR